MKRSTISRCLPGLVVWVAVGLVAPVQTGAQEQAGSVREAFFRAVAEYFEVPVQEVAIIGDWDLSPDEVPVVLFLARRAGVSPDALIGFRRGGRSWMEVSTRFGLGARVFHVPLPPGEALGPLTRANEEFRSRPSVEWGRVLLEDAEIIAYVNVMVLSAQAGVSHLLVLEKRNEAGSFMAAYPLLRNR